ncbi:MAG: hypothetical protein L6266_00360, partial [Nanoarchaeota archaeon]|nr:hypothetical protein [Nanoarchaeota archaeon]
MIRKSKKESGNRISGNIYLVIIFFGIIFIFASLFFMKPVFAGTQTFEQTLNPTWTAIATKGGGTSQPKYYNWTVEYPCPEEPGRVNCYMSKIEGYVRYMETGGGAVTITTYSYGQIADKSLRNCASPSTVTYTNARYFAYNTSTIPGGGVIGPGYECAIGAGSNTCALTINDGFNESVPPCYSVRVQGGSNSPGSIAVSIDTFNVRYTWNWRDVKPVLTSPSISTSFETPANTTQGGWGQTFNFTVLVNEPDDADTNVSVLYSPTLSWGNEIATTLCEDCSIGSVNPESVSIYYKGFNCEDIATYNYYMFNATDNDTASGPWSRTWGPYAPNYFTILKDNVTFNYVSGNLSETNRGLGTPDTYANFVLYGNDTTNQSKVLDGLTIRLDVTTDTTTYTTGVLFNESHAGGNISFDFGALCAYGVGPQKWRFYTGGSGTDYSGDICYFAAYSDEYTVNVTDEFTVKVAYPTQDDSVNVDSSPSIGIKGTIDDSCGSVNDATAGFLITGPSYSYVCNDSSNDIRTGGVWSEGTGYYNCTWNTTIGIKGRYNVSFFANKTYYPANETLNTTFSLTGSPSLTSPTVNPQDAPWGAKHNFSVLASAGSDTRVLTVKAYISGTAPYANNYREIGTFKQCTGSNCGTLTWPWNFSGCDDKKLWYFKFNLTSTEGGGTATSSEAYTDLKKEPVELIHQFGDATATFETPATFIVRMKDTADGRAPGFNITPQAYVGFEVTVDGNIMAYVGKNLTNISTANSTYSFLPPESCEWSPGTQYWRAFINTTLDTCYGYTYNTTALNYSVYLDIPCFADLQVPTIKKPTYIFQNNTFKINATLQAIVNVSSNTLATINVPNDWIVEPSRVINIGNLTAGSTRDASWNVTPTTFGTFSANDINVTFNNTELLNVTSTFSLFVYKLKTLSNISKAELYDISGNLGCLDNICNVTNHLSIPNVTLGYSLDDNNVEAELTTNADEYILAYWICEAGDYYYSNISIYLESNTSHSNVKVSAYNGTKYNPIYQNAINDTAEKIDVKVLREQMVPEEGYCKVKVENLGELNLLIDYMTLTAYYSPTALIKEIKPNVNNLKTTGIEPEDKFFNVSVILENPLSTSYTIDLTLNITNSNNVVINSTKITGLTLNANSELEYNFTNYNTTGWALGEYKLIAYVADELTLQKSKDFTFKTINITSKAERYRCNGTKEYFNVTIIHPFNDKISYNLSLELPTDWSSEPASKIINLTSLENYTFSFNITSSQNDENITINATIDYTYLVAPNNKTTQPILIESGTAVPIIEVVREAPIIVGYNKVFDLQLSVHNKGCAATTGITKITEILSEGWTPANPGLRGDVTLNSSSTNLITNILTWELNEISVNKYAVLTYQIRSPTSYSTTGNLNFNVSWAGKNMTEENQYYIQTLNYSGESHIEFDLTVVQQSENYPWPEPRSAQVGTVYNYSLEAKNIGDSVASGWNVTAKIPTDCNVSNIYNDGVWHPSTRKIEWNLSVLSVYASAYLNFSLNCTNHGKIVLDVEALKNTTQRTAYENDTQIGCTSASCSSSQEYSFSQPSSMRYGNLKNMEFYIHSDWTAIGLTIGEGQVNITGDNEKEYTIWQDYYFENINSNTWINFTIENLEKYNFINAPREIKISSYTNGMTSSNGNVTVEKVIYTWEHGKYFRETQNLFVKIKEYEYFPLYDNFTLLIDSNSTKTTGGWGESYNFTVLVKDRFARNVTVFAWHKKGTAAYTQINNWTCEDCGAWTQANFSYVYNGTDIGSWKVKANFTNLDGPSETSETEYTIEADDTNADYSFPTYDSMVNRSQITNFTINIYDRDNQSTPGYLVEG